MNLTPAQERAIYNHTENMIVVAGAGSGKTFVLVERYLALLDAHPDWPLNALVAITFTQKAAQEMRDRVRQHLQRQAEEASGAAAEAWARRLAAMDSARIDTIHGLCATILRGNAAEAGIDPSFEVLDEIEARVLLEGAVDDVFRSLEASDPELELFAEYGEGLLEAELIRLIPTEPQSVPNDLFTYWLDQWVRDAHEAIRRFQNEILEIGQFEANGDDALSRNWRSYAEAAARLGEQGEQQALYVYLEQLQQIATLSLMGGSARIWGDDLADAKAALKKARELAQTTLKQIGAPPDTVDQRAAHLLPLWISLAERVRITYRTAKDERGVLDFDDLERLTCDVLEDDSVRNRYLGAEFRHVLVDEFQDTNMAQWALIQRIADPTLPGCLFVVGDPKQSIYGFRGADVSVFEQVRAFIEKSGSTVDLNRSFRTHQGLVACFNFLFERLLVRDEHSPVAQFEVEFGGGMEAERDDAPAAIPSLELLLLDKEKLNEAEDEEQAARKWEARLIARRLREIVEDERRLIYDKRTRETRSITYGDAALLFQAMSSVTIYEAALKAEAIPYLTVTGKGYYERQEVWDLLNLLRALHNPADTLSLAAALRSPLFSLSDDALLSLRLIEGEAGQPMPLWKALDYAEAVPQDERDVVLFARDTLRNLQRLAGRVTIAELLQRALEATGYLAVLTGLPDGKRLRGNVEKLVEKAETSGRITLSAFAQYLKDMSEAEVREGEAALESSGVVQLMTVHKSKGLEFPLVVLVDASYSGGGKAGLVNGLSCKVYDEAENKHVAPFAYRQAERLDALRESAERRRLLYVAATRAQDYLLVSGQVTCKADQPIAARGWLGGLLKALNLCEIEALESQIVTYAWGEARIDFPVLLGEVITEEHLIDWSEATFDSEPPSLLQSVPHMPIRYGLTATQVADLGNARHANPAETRLYYAERWRQSVLQDAPTHIEAARRKASARVGEIVHRAIRWPLPEDEADLHELLRRYAWEEKIVDESENHLAVGEALTLLMRVQSSDVFQAVAQARQVYREVPFVYQTNIQTGQEARTIHGVIDLLIEDAQGRWELIDYKTSWLGAAVTDAQLREHARRFHLQMGVYAAAVEELVGNAPLVYIHYIRYARTIVIDEDEWRIALAQLEDYIGDILR